MKNLSSVAPRLAHAGGTLLPASLIRAPSLPIVQLPSTLNFFCVFRSTAVATAAALSGQGVPSDYGGSHQGARGRDHDGKHRGVLRRESRQRTACENNNPVVVCMLRLLLMFWSCPVTHRCMIEDKGVTAFHSNTPHTGGQRKPVPRDIFISIPIAMSTVLHPTADYVVTSRLHLDRVACGNVDVGRFWPRHRNSSTA